jgi:hypothetical protein
MTIGRVWRRARQAAFTAEVAASPLAKTPYDLRHAAVSTWLNGGVRRPRWPSGLGTRSRSCSGSTLSASTRSDTSTPTPRRMSLLRTSIPDVCNAIPEHPSQSRCQCSVVTHALSYSTWRRCGSCRGIGHSSRARWRSGTPIVANHSPERHLGVDRQAERAWLAMQASSDTACWSASTPLGRGRGAMLVDVDIAAFGAVRQFP